MDGVKLRQHPEQRFQAGVYIPLRVSEGVHLRLAIEGKCTLLIYKGIFIYIYIHILFQNIIHISMTELKMKLKTLQTIASIRHV